MSDDQTVNPTGDVLYGITLAYVALVTELVERGAVDRGHLVARLAKYADATGQHNTPLARHWLNDVRAIIEAGEQPHG